MQSYSVWSVGVGGWGRLKVRLHVLFIVFAVSTVYLAWLAERTPGVTGLIEVAWMSLLVLFASSLLHGIGHYLALEDTDEPLELILGPMGEVSQLPSPYHPRAELVMHLAGPLANLAMGLLAASVLLIHGDSNLLPLLHPLEPVGLIEGDLALVLLRLTLWINWLLLLANLIIPTYPFDGGRILRAAIWGLFPNLGRRWAGFVVYCFAQFVALGLLVFSWIFRDQQFHGLLPVWLALTLLAVIVFFSARQELASDSLVIGSGNFDGFPFDSTESPFTAGESAPRRNSFSQWLEQRRQARLVRKQQREAEEERRVDDILRRVHLHGMDNLSSEERAILIRVSHRFRDRLDDPAGTHQTEVPKNQG